MRRAPSHRRAQPTTVPGAALSTATHMGRAASLAHVRHCLRYAWPSASWGSLPLGAAWSRYPPRSSGHRPHGQLARSKRAQCATLAVRTVRRSGESRETRSARHRLSFANSPVSPRLAAPPAERVSPSALASEPAHMNQFPFNPIPSVCSQISARKRSKRDRVVSRDIASARRKGGRKESTRADVALSARPRRQKARRARTREVRAETGAVKSPWWNFLLRPTGSAPFDHGRSKSRRDRPDADRAMKSFRRMSRRRRHRNANTGAGRETVNTTRR